MMSSPIFKVPNEIYLEDGILTLSDLRIAIEDNDMKILEPLIKQIIREAAERRVDSLSFAFLIVAIRPIIRSAISREFATYREEVDFADFFSGALTAIWLKLPFYDSTKSSFSTFVYRQTRDGNRTFTRNSEKFYGACKKFNGNPSLIAEQMSVTYSQEAQDFVYEDTSLIQIEENDLAKKRLEAIDRIWKNLDDRTQRILKLHLLDDHSPKQVAELIGPPITEKTVYEYINRAINKARRAVEKEYNEERG